jgi:transcriptional regulator with XRE-family HTH domain
MREIRRLAGWTLKRLSASSRISITQLSQYECGKNGLRVDQVELCKRLLLRAAAEREQMISKLFPPTSEGTMGSGWSHVTQIA